MRKILSIIALSIVAIGCNINPSKEARIQKLESEMLQSMEKIEQLENRIEKLENVNEQLKLRLEKLDNQ